MLLGHWYLVTPKLSPAPLRRMMWLLARLPRAAGRRLRRRGRAGQPRRRWAGSSAGSPGCGWRSASCCRSGITGPGDRWPAAAASLQASTGLLYIGLASSWPARSPAPASPTSPACRSEPDAGHGRARSPSCASCRWTACELELRFRGDGGRRLVGDGRPRYPALEPHGRTCEPARNGAYVAWERAARRWRRGRLPAAGQRRSVVR